MGLLDPNEWLWYATQPWHRCRVRQERRGNHPTRQTQVGHRPQSITTEYIDNYSFREQMIGQIVHNTVTSSTRNTAGDGKTP